MTEWWSGDNIGNLRKGFIMRIGGESCNGLYKECSCNSEARWCDSLGCTLTVNLCFGGED